ncbi:MAG: oxidoreductase [Candidatus Bathyarchaeia archaeon]
MLKIGLFKFSSCSGCQLSFLRLNEKLLDLVDKLDIAYWVMVSDNDVEDSYDVAFVEGSISTPEDIYSIKDVRARSKVLIAFGACASFGGLNSIRNYMVQKDVEKIVYGSSGALSVKSIISYPIDFYVDVDIYLGGCPPSLSDILEVIKASILSFKPRLPDYPVCVECKLSENECLLVNGEPCMGPIIRAGCGALCPSLGRTCEGCYGPQADPNPNSLADKLREIGLSEDEILCRLRKYAGMHRDFRGIAKL